MSLKYKILTGIGFVLIAIQFIQSASNKSDQISGTDISKMVIIPDSVLAILKNACYDCHSNNTRYPWYATFQPMGWIMADHIKEGKEELNFSVFGSYSSRRQLSKLNGIANSIKDDIMPLQSYKLMHKNARLSTKQKVLLTNWIRVSKERIAAQQ